MSLSVHRRNAFTLVEIMIVLTILGLLISALIPTYSSYIQRGRDTTRLSHIDGISKTLTLYFSENDSFPSADIDGCVDSTKLLKYSEGKTIADPLPEHSNGCAPGKYGYGMSTGILTNPNVFLLLAITEQPYGGNYSGDLFGFTGTLIDSAYHSGLTLTQRGAGQYYVRVP